MKYMKKNQKKASPVILGMVIAGLVFLILVAALAMILVNSGNDEMVLDESTTAMESAEPVEVAKDTTVSTEEIVNKQTARDYEVAELVDGQIETPYGVLYYPEGMADLLLIANTSQEPYTLEFYAVMEGKKELRLFDISLGEGADGNMGMVVTPDGEVPMDVLIYNLTMDKTWSEGEIATAYAMQEEVNNLIAQLIPEGPTGSPSVSDQPDEDQTMNNLEIVTPYGTLYYPAQWINTVSYECDDAQEDVYKVHFYSQIDGLADQLLFSIYFGGDEGDQLGAVMIEAGIPVPVYLLMAQLELDGLSDENVECICAMQEACNLLIARLPLLN